MIKIFTAGNPTKEAFNQVLSSADLPSVGSFEKLNEDFTRFSLLMSRPDPHFDIAFLLADKKKRGYLEISDVESLLEKTNLLPEDDSDGPLKFDMNCDVIRRYFGDQLKSKLRIDAFTSFFCQLHQEMGRQGLWHY